MNIIIPYTKFDPINIFFLEKRLSNYREPNDIAKTEKLYNTTGNYTKIMYSTKYFIMKCIYLTIPIIPSMVNKSHITISICDLTDDFLNRIKSIEGGCLSYYADYFSIEKQPVYHLYNQFISGNIKYYRENHGSQIYLKITGIWDTEMEYGITYKIMMG